MTLEKIREQYEIRFEQSKINEASSNAIVAGQVIEKILTGANLSEVIFSFILNPNFFRLDRRTH